MAVAFKSSGSGVATETSGAALSPACPAVVDAGDILIAHVFWEGTTTAPNTPGGWALLSGPHVIETTIARHWVFGKVAAGTEDASAIAFGNPAVTTQRGARIYSFSGRTAGTIAELVNGFAHTSNANDPTFPNVTTTMNGALAVALVGQNDNNTLASATGESGGDWVEATAEFTANLTPGLALGIQTCTPTANPGTVSGGTDNTTNDPAGVIGFQIMPSAPQTASAGVGAVTVTGLAPTIQTPQSASPGVGALTATGFAPTVQTPQVAAAGLGALVATGLAPTVTTTEHTFARPGVGAATVTGFAPTVAISDHQRATPGVGAVTLSGLAPTVTTTDHQRALADVGALTLAGFAPSVAISDHQVAEPDNGELVLIGYAPYVSIGTHEPEQYEGYRMALNRRRGRR